MIQLTGISSIDSNTLCAVHQGTKSMQHTCLICLVRQYKGLRHRNDDIQNDLHVVYSARQQIYLPLTCTVMKFKCIPQESWVRDIHKIGQTVSHNCKDIVIVMSVFTFEGIQSS